MKLLYIIHEKVIISNYMPTNLKLLLKHLVQFFLAREQKMDKIDNIRTG